MSRLGGFALGLACAAAATGAQANLLVNGSFETPVIASASFQNVTAGAEPTGFGWAVSAGNVDIISTGVLGITSVFAQGVQALDLVGTGTAGGVQQSFATAAGTTYLLQFAYSNNPIVSGSASATVTVTTSLGTTTGTITHTGATSSNLDWSTYTTTFVGDGQQAVLRFTNTAGGTNGGIFLDAVQVNVVPEPAAWMLMLAGAAALGARRFRTAACT